MMLNDLNIIIRVKTAPANILDSLHQYFWDRREKNDNNAGNNYRQTSHGEHIEDELMNVNNHLKTCKTLRF